MKHFTETQKRQARKANLYTYLKKYHYDDFRHESNNLRFLKNRSINIGKDYCGYTDFATGETGNSIDFLVNYMGYSIDDAVLSLCGEIPTYEHFPATDCNINYQNERVSPDFPKKSTDYRILFAYLQSRGIPADTIQSLINMKLLYQSDFKNNIVFINYAQDFAELRGTYTYGSKQFHGVVKNSRDDGCWWFRTSKDTNLAYVCEAAIDAISLYLIHKYQKNKEDAYYISIAGVAKQRTIDRIKKHFKAIIAVDNDDAGDICRNNNQDCEYIIPIYKDWNEDLINLGYCFRRRRV